MNNTRVIKRRIRSVKNTSQITRAMHLVAANKMKRAQERAQRARVYAEATNQILHQLGQGKQELDQYGFLAGGKHATYTLVIMITSDRGFCGGLNTNLFNLLADLPSKGLQLITIGRKGFQFAKKQGIPIFQDTPAMIDQLEIAEVEPVVETAVDGFKQGRYKKVVILYNQFINTLIFKPKLEQLLPIKLEQSRSTTAKKQYIFEPSPKRVFNQLVPHLLATAVYHALLESSACEHSARMMAMKNATDRAGEMLDGLQLEFNHARQAGITQEIAEIVSGSMG